MPGEWLNKLPTAEEIWIGGHKDNCTNLHDGWQMSFGSNDAEFAEDRFDKRVLFRHYRWHRDPNFPEIFADMMKHLHGEDISMFVGDQEETRGSLGWHVDNYHVWAFNIEGETEWEWFDLYDGKFKSHVVKPGYILTMPLGISHRVKVLSGYRTSISIISRYGATSESFPF